MTRCVFFIHFFHSERKAEGIFELGQEGVIAYYMNACIYAEVLPCVADNLEALGIARISPNANSLK